MSFFFCFQIEELHYLSILVFLVTCTMKKRLSHAVWNVLLLRDCPSWLRVFLSLCVCDCTLNPQRKLAAGAATVTGQFAAFLSSANDTHEESPSEPSTLLLFIDARCVLLHTFWKSALCDVIGRRFRTTTSLKLQGVYFIILTLR